MTQMQADFSDRNAFVTGAGGGMGLQIARNLIGAGAQATLFDVKPAPDDLPPAPATCRPTCALQPTWPKPWPTAARRPDGSITW